MLKIILTKIPFEIEKFSVSMDLCIAIAKMRREFMAFEKKKLLFLDETHIRIGIHPGHTIVAPGQKRYIVVEDTDAYAPRYDMIACVAGDRVFPPIIFTPEERVDWNVRGVRKWMLHKYIHSVLAQAVEALDEYGVVLVMDRASIHNPEEVLQEFQDAGCGIIKEIRLMPAYAGKRLNPLDNSIFHEWKEAVRAEGPITKQNIVPIMDKKWISIPPEHIWAHYHHCALMCALDPYGDCPDPVAHQHPKPRKPAINH
jgi:hypothetical protein